MFGVFVCIFTGFCYPEFKLFGLELCVCARVLPCVSLLCLGICNLDQN